MNCKTRVGGQVKVGLTYDSPVCPDGYRSCIGRGPAGGVPCGPTPLCASRTPRLQARAPPRQAVTVWMRPSDRAPSYGACGQAMEKLTLPHRLPTLAALAPTPSPLLQQRFMEKETSPEPDRARIAPSSQELRHRNSPVKSPGGSTRECEKQQPCRWVSQRGGRGLGPVPPGARHRRGVRRKAPSIPRSLGSTRFWATSSAPFMALTTTSAPSICRGTWPNSPTASAAASRSRRCFPASHSSPCEPRPCRTECSSWLKTISEQRMSLVRNQECLWLSGSASRFDRTVATGEPSLRFHRRLPG